MNDYDALRLENQLCFPVYAAARGILKRYKPFLDEIGLTYTQYIVMMVLWAEQGTTEKKLGRLLRLDSGTLTPVLKKMENSGLLLRQRDPQDERSLLVSVTPKGMALREQAVTIPVRMGGCMDLSPDEMKTLYMLLYKLIGHLEK